MATIPFGVQGIFFVSGEFNYECRLSFLTKRAALYYYARNRTAANSLWILQSIIHIYFQLIKSADYK